MLLANSDGSEERVIATRKRPDNFSFGGELIPLTKDGWASDISPDGKLVAYVRPVVAGGLLWTITIMPFAPRQELTAKTPGTPSRNG